MASPTRWTWVWASSGSWCWTGNPGVLQYTGLQRVSQDKQLNWTNIYPTMRKPTAREVKPFTKLTREEEVEWSFSSRVLPQIPSPFHYTEFSEIYILIRLVVLFPLLFRNFLYQSQHKKISLVCNKWSSNPTFLKCLSLFIWNSWLAWSNFPKYRHSTSFL